MLTLPRARILLESQAADLLRDDFNASQVNPQLWLTVDTESKISVSSGILAFSGGKASPAHGDPMIESLRSYARTPGLTFEAKARAGTTNADGPYLAAVDRTPFAGTDWIALIAFGNAGSIGLWGPNTTAYAITNAYVANTWYWFRIVMLTTGSHYFYSADGVAWYRLWNEIVGTTTPVYAILQTYNQAGSADYIRLYQGSVPPARLIVASPASVTPTLGSELVTAWTNAVTHPYETFTASGLDITSAINTSDFGDADTNGIAFVAGAFYQATITPTINSGANLVWQLRDAVSLGGSSVISLFSTLTSGANTKTFRIATSQTLYGALWVNNAATNFSAVGVSLKAFTLSTMLGLLGDPGIKAGVFDQVVTVPSGFRGGFACCLNDEANPTYMLLCYTDRTLAALVKYEAGTPTVLISTATGVTYADARRLRIVITPVVGSANSSVALFYESAASTFTQIGAVQTVDLSLYGTLVATFSSDVSVVFGQSECWGGINV